MTIHDPIPAPIPGDPDTVHHQAQILLSTANALRDAARELRAMASDSVTISEAVDEVREQARESETDTDRVERRYRGAAETMMAYRNSLENAQGRANNARNRISDNNADAAYWRRREMYLRDVIASGEGSQEVLDEFNDVSRRLRTFESEFYAAMAEYNHASDDRNDAVSAAIAALDSAAEAAGLDDGFWDRVGALLEYMYEWAQEHLAPWIDKLRSLLELIKGILDILCLIVSILALFMPFLAPLAALLTLASIALAAAILLCSLALFALGKESLGRVLSDAIGLAVGVITARMGGVNVFKPSQSLVGLSQVVSPAAWSSGFAAAKLNFQIVQAIAGNGEAVGIYGMEIAEELFKLDNVSEMVLTISSEIGAGIVEGGLDITLDLFPEGGGGSWGGNSPDWQLDANEVVEAVGGPVVNALSGGWAGPAISIVESVNDLMVPAS